MSEVPTINTVDNVPPGEQLAKVMMYYGMIDRVEDDQMKVVCPFHGDVNPSLMASFDNGKWYCFGCGEYGDAFDMVKAMEKKYSGYNDLTSLVIFQHILNGSAVSSYKLPKRVARSYGNKADKDLYAQAYMFYHGLRQPDWEDLQDGEYEAKAVLHYMEERGFTAHALNLAKCKVTYQRDYPMVFPIMDNGKFKGWVSRTTDSRIEQKRKYLYNKGFRRARTVVGTYGRYKRGTLVVVEGFMDRLRMLQNGVRDVVAIFGWHLAKGQLERLQSSGVTKVVCALDNDKAGTKGYVYLKEVMGEDNVVRWPFTETQKDPGELGYEDVLTAVGKLKEESGVRVALRKMKGEVRP